MRHIIVLLLAAQLEAQHTYEARIDAIRKTPGFVAFWDFVRKDGERFAPYQAKSGKADLRLDPVNYVLDYWGEGRAATMADFPLLGAGPFGEAVQFRAEIDANFRPVLLIPRKRIHDSGLDVKGPGKSVTLVAWVQRESGSHAIAGIWHEGTDLAANSKQAKRVEQGMRQYALFAGLAANNGASAAHVSENGGSSFGDRYAHNLSVTPEKLPATWSMVGLRFDNQKNTVTSSLDGKETEYWVDNPEKHPFFQWPAKAWREGTYSPPESKAVARKLITRSGAQRVELLTYPFTKVSVRYEGGKVVSRELVALRANPFWFAHDLFSPASSDAGGPFTIGRVIHSSRGTGFIGAIGGVAVFNRVISSKQLAQLARIGRAADGSYSLLRRAEVQLP